MFWMIIANILGIFTFLFFVWKTLKEDYQYERIFNLASSSIIGFCVSLVINYYLPSIYWFWITLLGMFIGFQISIYKQKMSFFESFEGFGIGSIIWIGFIYLSDAIKNASFNSFLASWFTSMCVFLYFFLRSHYRSFTWYKSGKVGFSGVLTLTSFFILRAIATLITTDIMSFAGKAEIFLSGSASLLLLVLLYNLSTND